MKHEIKVFIDNVDSVSKGIADLLAGSLRGRGAMGPIVEPIRTDRILVVDDCKTNRVLLRAILQAQGFTVDESATGAECISYCEHEIPAVIFLDIMMPELSGIEVCRHIREQHSKSDLPIIMVSTLSEASDVVAGLQAGANDYLSKPVDRLLLLARLENQLALSRAQQQLQAQKHASERSLRIQNSMGDVLPEAVLVHDSDDKVIYFNARLRELCGGLSPGNMNEVLCKLIGGEFKRELEGYRMQLHREPNRTIEVELQTSEMEPRCMLVRSSPIPTADDRPLRLWLWRDTTLTRSLERRVSQQIKLDTVGLFAAGIAHNFNNLLGGILGAAELLDHVNAGNEKALRYSNIIKRAVSAGIRLTRKMGVISKPADGTVDAHCDFSKVAQNLLVGYRELCGERISISLSASSNVPDVTMSDTQAVDVIANLVTNAVESIEGEGTVNIRIEPSSDRRHVDIWIKDSGSGIDEKALQRLFEPFFSTKKFDQMSGVSVEGRGLGLWNAYNVVKIQGGELKLSSVVGSGTEAHIRLPAWLPQ